MAAPMMAAPPAPQPPIPSPPAQAPRLPASGPTAPASVNVQNQGSILRAQALGGVAMGFLDEAVKQAGARSEVGQALVKMIGIGIKHFGQPAPLGAQELKLAQSRLSPMQQQPSPAGAMQARAGQLGLNVPRPAPGAAGG